MRIAVWRYCAGAKTDGESVVGGGRIARNLILTLARAGHRVEVLDNLTPEAARNFDLEGVEVQPFITDLSVYDAAVVMTGPFNVMYGKPVFRSYERLASLPSRGKALYCQWDVALPFNFYPERTKKFTEGCAVTSEHLQGCDWYLLSQLDEMTQRSKGASKSVGYTSFQYGHRRCFWELVELEGMPLQPCPGTINAIGYFGSDRPGRIREMKRWFGADNAPPVDVWGQWSEKSRKEFAPFKNVHFRGSVKESNVRAALNRYRMTFYMADPAYITSDFVAQRFIENAMAGACTAYSDKLQPTVARVVDPTWRLEHTSQLTDFFNSVRDNVARTRIALAHQERVLDWARNCSNNPVNVLKAVLT